MQRTFSVVLFGLLSAAFLSGCPEKKAEKETPTAEDPAAADQNGAAEDKKDEKADEKADKKNDEGGEEKEEEGGW
jgi:hypothetical protein